MPRPCKRRRVCAMPACGRFRPDDAASAECVNMTVEEFECIRLIDNEGRTQEECAKSMNVARTTVQAIYSTARAKLADFLVNRKELRIEGGDYALCDGRACGGGCCRKRRMEGE